MGILKRLFRRANEVKVINSIPTFSRLRNWEPKVYILQKDLPNLKRGARFQQSYWSDKVYFCVIPISSDIPEKDQVGIIEFEAKCVENSEWFTQLRED